MRKRHYLAILLTLVGFCLILVLLLGDNAARISPLELKLRKVEIGMSIVDVEEIFGREPDMLWPSGSGSDLHVWFAERDDRASVVVLDGRATEKAWARMDPSVVEKLQNLLGMPWWEYNRDFFVKVHPADEVVENIPASTLLDAKDPRIEAVFPGQPVVEITPNGKQLILERKGGGDLFLLDIENLPERIGVLDDPALAKKHLDLIQDRTIKFQNGRTLTFAKDFLYHGRFPTRLIEYVGGGVSSHRVYFILTPNHFYHIGVGGTRRFVVSGRACEFMTSFKAIE